MFKKKELDENNTNEIDNSSKDLELGILVLAMMGIIIVILIAVKAVEL